jgi:hypothetical protein
MSVISVGRFWWRPFVFELHGRDGFTLTIGFSDTVGFCAT